MMSDASQEQAIEATAASVGDHAMANCVLSSKIAWPGGLGAGVVCSWRWGTSSSGELDVNEAPREASCVCWINSSTQSASKASPVKSSIGALPCRLPLL